MNDLVSISNSICDRQRWRRETVYLGIQWSPTPNGHRALELRNDRSENTSARPVCTVRAEPDGYTATCMCCGSEFAPVEELNWLGSWPTGICCCSDKCRRRFEEEAITVCEHCGAVKPTRFDVHGNHSCVLCASRAFRAHYEAERRPTEPPNFAEAAQ